MEAHTSTGHRAQQGVWDAPRAHTSTGTHHHRHTSLPAHTPQGATKAVGWVEAHMTAGTHCTVRGDACLDDTAVLTLPGTYVP